MLTNCMIIKSLILNQSWLILQVPLAAPSWQRALSATLINCSWQWIISREVQSVQSLSSSACNWSSCCLNFCPLGSFCTSATTAFLQSSKANSFTKAWSYWCTRFRLGGSVHRWWWSKYGPKAVNIVRQLVHIIKGPFVRVSWHSKRENHKKE